MRILILTLAFFIPATAYAQPYSCQIIKVWNNTIHTNNYQTDQQQPKENDTPIVVDPDASFIKFTDEGKPKKASVKKGNPSSAFTLSVDDEFYIYVHTVFPEIKDSHGGVLGTAITISDDDTSPKGMTMYRMTCKPL